MSIQGSMILYDSFHSKLTFTLQIIISTFPNFVTIA